MDELYTFSGKKIDKCYLWTSIAITQTGSYFYFYHLSRNRTSMELFNFNRQLPDVNTVYSDKNFSYNSVYRDKVIQEKSRITNIIENLNSQIRDKISYLVRRSKGHSKSLEWLNYRLAIFFNAKNLRYY